MFARWGQSVYDSYLSKSETQDYVPLCTSEDNKELGVDFRPEKKYKWHTIYNVLLVSFCMVGCGFIGFALGYRIRSSSNFKAKDFLTPPGEVKYPMVYNLTYTKEPSPESDAAWDSMFPKGVGFVKHPEISPNLSGLAVFHELHCVNMLRVGYYAALSGNLADMQHIHDHNKRPDPHHLRHCFDYLRQSLICNVDTNLEPVDFKLGGVTGWKFQRTCRDFERVKEWAEEWRSWPEGIGESKHV